jgi:hypothetical protein
VLQAEETGLEQQIVKLMEKRDKVRREMAALRTPGVKSEPRSPRPKVKTERESTRVPSPPEAIDLT